MIGYYVHHHGRGHAHRAAQIAAALDEPVVALSSLALDDPLSSAAFAGTVTLARDDAPGGRDHTASGALHWAPLDSPGYAGRMRAVAEWIATARPRLVVVDVSVEVTVLCRALGVPVVVMAGAGERPDDPHTLAYRLASVILAPWPGEVYRPAYLRPFADRTHYVGAMSRFDGAAPAPPPGDGSVLLLAGAGGGDVTTADVETARAATPARRWTVCGLPGTPWRDDVWSTLLAADVVVTHAGQNALAEVAAARRPAVVIAQQRPFGEQHATAGALDRAGLALALDGWPSVADWPDVLAAAQQRPGDGWRRWNRGDGAACAAHVLSGTRSGTPVGAGA